VWNPLSPQYLTHGSYFNDVMRNVAGDHPHFLPSLQRSEKLVITSDFTGDHRGSRFTTFSFMLVPTEAMPSWDHYRRSIRQRFALLDRRIAYSKLNDGWKRAAITEFCRVGNAIPGLSVTILIDKRIKSLFNPSGGRVPPDLPIGGQTFSRWKPAVFERVLRAAYFVALFVAGLSAPAHRVVWITDEDDIAPNSPSLADLRHIFRSILGHIQSHPVGDTQIETTGTTASSDLLCEDLTAIPDLIAGAVNTLVCSYGAQVPLHSFMTLAPDKLDSKARAMITTLFEAHAPLRKMIFTIEPTDHPGKLLHGCPRVEIQPGLVLLPGGRLTRR
jgi:hypothetical protein